MRFCPIICLLPKENFNEGTLNKDASDHISVVCKENFALIHNGTSHK